MNAIKDNSGVLALLYVFTVLLAFLWLFKDSATGFQIVATIEGGVVGAIINIVTGTPTKPPNTNIGGTQIVQGDKDGPAATTLPTKG